jgi:hypothetical protein
MFWVQFDLKMKSLCRHAPWAFARRRAAVVHFFISGLLQIDGGIFPSGLS